MDEHRAQELAVRAVEQAGGTRMIYGNPKHPFAAGQTVDRMIEGHSVEIRPGEISSPAIVTVEGWVFQILDDDIELLMRPKKVKKSQSEPDS